MKQEYYQQSAIANYPLGMRLAVDERVFRYAKAAHAIVDPYTQRLCVCTDQILAVNDLLTAAPAAFAGDKTVTVTVGAFQGGAVAVNELVGGWVEIWQVGPLVGMMWRRIVANSAVSGGTFTITVDKPFNNDVPAGGGVLSCQVSVHPSIYRAVKLAVDAGLADYQVAVGLAPIPVALNGYFWLQTWGPCFIASRLDYPLAIADFVDVYMYSAGTIQSSKVAAVGTANSPQRVGYALGAGAYGSGAIMLQLAP